MIGAHIELFLIVTGALTTVALLQFIAPASVLLMIYGEAPTDDGVVLQGSRARAHRYSGQHRGLRTGAFRNGISSTSPVGTDSTCRGTGLRPGIRNRFM